MSSTAARPSVRSRRTRPGLVSVLAAALVVLLLFMVGLTASPKAYAADVASVNLGVAGTYSALGAEEVTNTGLSVLDHNVGVSPGSAISGFPPGRYLGTRHAADAEAAAAQAADVTAYNDAASRAPTVVSTDDPHELGGGEPLVAGVYKSNVSAGLTGTLVLDGKNDPTSVWIFQVGTTLTTATNSAVVLTNGALACNVFWQVGSSATIGSGTKFVGTVLALASITANTGASVDGRLLAQTGAVSLDTNAFQSSGCGPTATATVTQTVTAAPTATVTVTAPTATVTETQTVAPTATVTETAAPSATATTTVTQTVAPTATATVTKTETLPPTSTPTATVTETAPTATVTETGPTATATATVTRTETVTPTATVTQTAPTATATVTQTVGPTATVTKTETGAPTATVTETETVAPTATVTTTRNVTQTATPTATTTVTETLTPTATVTQTVTATPTATSTSTSSESETQTATDSETEIATDSETVTVTSTSTSTSQTTLAETGAEAGTTAVAAGGVALLLAGGLLLLTARARARGRSQGRHR